MAGKYLMDTNSVIDYLDNKLPKKCCQKIGCRTIGNFGNCTDGTACMA